MAVHIRNDGDREKLDLFFFDPVSLSSQSLGKLSAKDIRRLIDAASKDDHFFYIKRYGEDFVARKYGKDTPRKDASATEDESRDISLDTLLGNR